MSPYFFNKITNTGDGYQALADFYATYRNDRFIQIEVTIGRYVDANMSSPLGAILEKLHAELNTISISVNDVKARTILQKNLFLCGYGYESIVDVNNTTLPYCRFKATDSLRLIEYADKQLLGKGVLPTLSPGLKREILKGIGEISANAAIHAQSEFVYVCGQFFPHKHLLYLTISDTGNGIKNTVNRAIGGSMSSVEAIKWAMIDGNTTKTDTPGGYGLDILRQLIVKNDGVMQIVSDTGYFELNAKGENHKQLKNEFPGTVVSLQFRTDDKHSYSLRGE